VRVVLLGAFAPLLLAAGAVTREELRALPAALGEVLKRREAA
jgi:hypothetical protein